MVYGYGLSRLCDVNDTYGCRSGPEKCWWVADQIYADHVLPPTHGYVVRGSPVYSAICLK